MQGPAPIAAWSQHGRSQPRLFHSALVQWPDFVGSGMVFSPEVLGVKNGLFDQEWILPRLFWEMNVTESTSG